MDYETANASYEYGQGDQYVILIHGFPSIPYDLMPLGQYLANQGFHVIGVKLPGFGGTKEELLHHADWHLWYAEIKKTINEIKLINPKNIFVAGISMGGCASLYTASQFPEIKAVVSINGPVLIEGFSHKIVGIMSKFIKYFDTPDTEIAVLKPEAKKDSIVYELKKRYEFKGVLPAVASEVKWFRETDKNLKHIHQPLLICQSAKDSIVWLKNPNHILSKVSSKEKEIIWYPNSDHDLIRDYDSAQCFEDILNFFNRHL